MGMKVATLVAVSIVVSPTLLGSPAKAEGGEIAAGVAGGLVGGILLGGALAARPAPPPPVYYAPAPERIYVEEPSCRIVHERYWGGYGWLSRRVEVCD